jgi:4-cresol dehydrogenase (hydroxylating)
MGALANAKTWQQYKYGFGPFVDGIFSQSNLGIVTKMGFWLYPEPEAYFSGTVMVPKHDDIHALVENLALLINSGIVQGTTSVLNTASFGPPDPELARIRVGSSPAISSATWRRRDSATGPSICRSTGQAKVVAAQWEHAKG